MSSKRYSAAAVLVSIAAAVVLMLSGTGPSLAQQQTLPEVKVTAPPEGQGFKTDTTNINRTEMPLRDIPQFINTVPEPLIRQQAITSLQEALRNVPGVTFTAAEGGVLRYSTTRGVTPFASSSASVSRDFEQRGL